MNEEGFPKSPSRTAIRRRRCRWGRIFSNRSTRRRGRRLRCAGKRGEIRIFISWTSQLHLAWPLFGRKTKHTDGTI